MMTRSTLADDLPKPVLWVCPTKLTITGCNPSAEEMCGLSERHVRGRDLSSVLPGSVGLEDLVTRVSSDRSSVVVREVEIDTEPAEITLFPAGDDVGVLIVRLRAFTPKASQGQSVQVLGQMIAHEIKNPLAGIKGAAQLLRDDVASHESLALIDVITDEIDRVRRLAERLEFFGDTNVDSAKRCNIHTVLRSARKLMQHASENTVYSEDYDPSLPHVLGDTDQLMQAIVNLLKNASEAIGEDQGEIILRTRSRAGARRGRVGLPVEVQVIDTGKGIPADIQSRVFEPFVTTKPSGRGLGLALVARTVEAHGGIVEVASKPGRTRVSILLPAAPEQGVAM